MEVGEGNPRTISIWFKPYLQSHWGSGPNHHTWDPGLYWMGTTDGRFGTARDGWGIRGWSGGSVGGNNNYQRFISQHNSWDPQVAVSEGMMDSWVHVAHIYTGTDLQVYVNGIKRYEAAQAMYTSDKPVGNPTAVKLSGLSEPVMVKCTGAGELTPSPFPFPNKACTSEALNAFLYTRKSSIIPLKVRRTFVQVWNIPNRR